MREVFRYSYGEEAYGIVYEDNEGFYHVYEIPQYGGEERFVEKFTIHALAIKCATSFT